MGAIKSPYAEQLIINGLAQQDLKHNWACKQQHRSH